MKIDHYKLIEAFWESGSDVCEECKYCNKAREPHGEYTAECDVLVKGNTKDCIALDDILEGKYPTIYEPEEEQQ